ncbi:MAG: Uncharacterized protein G01um101430_252 [Parcubacteria group bacterium Gr01-1014_30]|nr:MAG: Uncharacterized protein G01um101430_252 [Parcubacteria group bacterium Gr01-1014_30]
MKEIELIEVSSPGCHICKMFEEFWHSIEKDWPSVKYKNVSVLTPEGQELIKEHMIFASPGIIINGELWATGGFDRNDFVEKLKKVSQ